MANSENIEFFNAFTIAFFDRLYASFPTPTTVNAKDVAGELLVAEPDDDVWYEKGLAAGHAVSFLAEEGFIRYKAAQIKAGIYIDVRLTAKGLAALNATPGSIEKTEPFISKVRSTVAQGARAVGKEAMNQLVQNIIAAGIKAVNY